MHLTIPRTFFQYAGFKNGLCRSMNVVQALYFSILSSMCGVSSYTYIFFLTFAVKTSCVGSRRVNVSHFGENSFVLPPAIVYKSSGGFCVNCIYLQLLKMPSLLKTPASQYSYCIFNSKIPVWFCRLGPLKRLFQMEELFCICLDNSKISCKM